MIVPGKGYPKEEEMRRYLGFGPTGALVRKNPAISYIRIDPTAQMKYARRY